MIPSADSNYKTARQAHVPEDLATEKISRDIIRIIGDAAEQGQMNIMYQVPLMIAGLPAYNTSTVLSKLNESFTACGYITRVDMQRFNLAISWERARPMTIR